MLKELIGKKKQEGFTLIEIVLVLAIAGLIFVIVFLGVAGAQRARRDAQRKSDLGRYSAALEQYAGNNDGAYPAADGTPVGDSYFNLTTEKDPNGTAYSVQATAPTAAGQIQYDNSANCAGSLTTQPRKYAVKIYQEQGAAYCIDND